MDKRINKVKYNPKTGEVLIEYEIISADDVKVTLKSEDRPLPEFIEQFQKLVPYVEQICQFEKDFCNESHVSGVSLSWSHEIMGAVITCLIPLDTANGPMVVNTPHIPSGQYNEGGQAPVLPRGCVTVIEELIVQAERYIDGERNIEPDAQMKLPFDNNETTMTITGPDGIESKPITLTQLKVATEKLKQANK